jgi:threonine synthase
MGKNIKFKLICINCNKNIDPKSGAVTCPDCGPFDGTLDVVYEYETAKLKIMSKINIDGISVFDQFLPILPFNNILSLPPTPVGNTPLFNSPNLSRYLGFGNLLVKDDTRNPSASLKDRASAVTIAMARESDYAVIAAASTGNAASSLVTLATSTDLKTVIFVPKTIPKPKLTQLLIHNAEVFCLDCNYDKAFDLCGEACEKFGWYNRNTAVNPFTGEGKKTAALEIARESDKMPDAVVCPVGDGCILGGLYKGFYDIHKLGLIDRIPRLFGVQAEGASPVVKAFQQNSKISSLPEVNTIADSISVGRPRDGAKALRAVNKSNGAMIAVTDNEILSAQKVLASEAGVFVEPAAAASCAGLIKLKNENYLNSGESIVLLLTGHGLKDIDTAMKNINSEIEILKPDLNVISERVEQMEKRKSGE